ncbi:MAG: nicotinamide riboside transporter PnuC [Dysgonomonas sp.]|nr:nicotinamide riboside transporter PnuC [Dysgonomonas sp.]
MDKIRNFLDYITGKGSHIHTIIWFSLAFILTAYSAYYSWMEGLNSPVNIIIFSATALIGYLSVVSLAFRRPLSGNILGINANIGEMYTQFQFQNIGMVFSAAYYLILHIIGLFTWSKKENQNESGLIKTTTTDLRFIVFTILSGITGCVLLFIYGEQWGLIYEKNSFRFALNIVAFMIGILSQMTMILRKPWSWYLWIVSNIIWFVLNLISGNYIFMIQSVLYEWNCILAVYIWHKEKAC